MLNCSALLYTALLREAASSMNGWQGRSQAAEERSSDQQGKNTATETTKLSGDTSIETRAAASAWPARQLTTGNFEWDLKVGRSEAGRRQRHAGAKETLSEGKNVATNKLSSSLP